MVSQTRCWFTGALSLAIHLSGMIRIASSCSRLAASLLLGVLIIATVRCGKETEPKIKDGAVQPPAKERLLIVCSSPIIREVVWTVAGGTTDEKLIHEIDLHTLAETSEGNPQADLRAGDVLLLREADLVFAHGQELEGELTKTILANAEAGRIHWLADGKRAREVARDASQPRSKHHWMNPADHEAMVADIVAALTALAPQHEAVFIKGARLANRNMGALKSKIDQARADIEPRIISMLTHRPSIAELGRMLGAKVTFIELEFNDPPTVNDRQRLIDVMAEAKVNALVIDAEHYEAWQEVLESLAASQKVRWLRPVIHEEWSHKHDGVIGMIAANIESLAQALKE